MKSFLTSTFLFVGLAGSALAAGCQSTNAPAATGTGTLGQAVACDKCKTVWVQVPQSNGKRVTGYSSRQEMQCPECKSAVENFFASGQLKHACATCGGNMSVCEAH